MGKHKHTAEEGNRFSKHGIDLSVYGHSAPSATVARVEVQRGHFQEFVNQRSTYIYYVISGQGVFYLNGEAVAVRATDLIAVPPDTRIYYFGAMEMVLTVTPAFDEKDEKHVRFISESESPY
ncbi:cupin domain-containing protein [Streptomyces sp. NPDC057445]|uniref:cupin domain-containing protein n=1 Tax=Streptomyces sp. NPDC057445 TaxID=3346136 RepID=UPI0036774758